MYAYNSQNCRKQGAVFGSVLTAMVIPPDCPSGIATGDTLLLACPLEGTEPAQHVN